VHPGPKPPVARSRKGFVMVRWSVLAAGAGAVMCAAFVAGAAVPTPPAKSTEAKADAARSVVVVGQKTGYFNMAKVMRESKPAKTAVDRLNARKDRLAANLLGMRNMYLDLQAAAPKPNPIRGPGKDERADEIRSLAREIEDTDRALGKMLNERASIIIVELYDELRTVTAAVAHENGLTALLAFPDAATRDEAENPLVKELKLKPPALQPFFLDASVDFSDEIVRRLNENFALENNE
jgi:Skp family chaperone for outer membrane proteins